MNTKKAAQFITSWIKDYADQAGISTLVVGVSGGIDSALTSTLCAKTNLNVYCLEMNIHQKEIQVNRARKHIQWLEKNYPKVKGHSINLSSTYENFDDTMPKIDNDELLNMSRANARARLRMTTLYFYAQLYGGLVVGTGNKIEDFGVGFFTKYGDGGVDISPIADLMKSEVYAIAKDLRVHQDIIDAAPTDGLWEDDRTDEDQMGATYEELEWAMKFKGDEKELNSQQKEVLTIYRELHRANRHKMIPIPICKMPESI